MHSKNTIHTRTRVYTQPCNLRTGQELKEVEGARHTSCTVEMVNVSHAYDVAVVDECQLIGDRSVDGRAGGRAARACVCVCVHAVGSFERDASDPTSSPQQRAWPRLDAGHPGAARRGGTVPNIT